MHDIIDNRTIQLVDEINKQLPHSQAVKFAVGYFFLSGLTAVANKLQHVTDMKLLIGTNTNQKTIEQIAEGYRQLEQIAANLPHAPKRSERQEQLVKTAEKIGQVAAALEQSDEAEQVVTTLVQLIVSKRLQVRVYTKERFHAKAYIFDYLPQLPQKGIAMIGSSNFTLSGLQQNTELNVVVHGDGNHAALTAWFNELWEEAEPFEAHLMAELQQSWPLAQVTPYEIYLKTLYELTRDRLADEEVDNSLESTHISGVLADFQQSAVKAAVNMIERYRGCFVADVVGLGKSYIGAAIVKKFEQEKGARPLIICPASLLKMWKRYNEVYELNAEVISMSMLQEQTNGANLLLKEAYKRRNFVLVDESHNFRNPNTQRYRILQEFLDEGERSCVLLTATPRNKSAMDIYQQMRLFHLDDSTLIPIDPPELKQYFKQVEAGEKTLPDLLTHVLVRRTRNDILRYYGRDEQTRQKVDPDDFGAYRRGEKRAYVEVAGQPNFFPRRKLQTIDYSIETTYNGLYEQLKNYIGAADLSTIPDSDYLKYTRYSLFRFVKAERAALAKFDGLKRAGTTLRGLMRISLFKRFESSVHAFRRSIQRLLASHRAFERALDEGLVATGEEAQGILYEAEQYDETQLLDALQAIEQKYELADFQEAELRAAIAHDIRILEQIEALVRPITPQQDDKLQTLKRWLYVGSGQHARLTNGKCLIFTQYADTAQYLYDQLNKGQGNYAVIYSQAKVDKMELVARFAPKANADLWAEIRPNQSELELLIATDVLSEGLNLQDCDCVINYDLHWNPVRLIQRFGRIDRIGSFHAEVFGYNFLPETNLEKELHLRERLKLRIQEIHDTLGEDAAILDPTEQLNEEAFYAMYSNDSVDPLDADGNDLVNLNEAEELLRQLEVNQPALYQRIANLKDGVRCGRDGQPDGETIVLCRSGLYRQLRSVDKQGNTISNDTPTLLRRLKCLPETPAMPLPTGHNQRVRGVKQLFAANVWSRQAELRNITQSLAQQYLRRELRNLSAREKDSHEQRKINLLDDAFRQPLSAAVKRQINALRKGQVTGSALLESLSKIYRDYNLKEALIRHQTKQTESELPLVVCSLGLGA